MLRNESTRVRDAIDDLFLELRKVPPARAADVHQRRLAAPEGVVVGRHRAVAVAEVRVLLGPVEDVGVDVDEARDDVEARGIDDPRVRAPDRCSPPPRAILPPAIDDVHDGVDVVPRVDDVAVPDQQVDRGCWFCAPSEA